MKKFLIISIVLLLLSGGVFVYALKEYPPTLTPSDESSSQGEKATEPVAQTPTDSSDSGQTQDPGAQTTGGIFSAYRERASSYVVGMSKEQLVGQVIVGVASSPSQAASDMSNYHLGGTFFTGDCFEGLTKDGIRSTVASVNSASPIAPVLAVQEEGTTRKSRNSVTNHALVDESFESPRNIYEAGGLDAVKVMEDQKAQFLKDLGFNLNLAPVLDLAKESDQIMYSRSLNGDAQTTSEYARYVAQNNQQKGVSVALKHFPGYGTMNDEQSYSVPVVDVRTADEIRGDGYQPFKAGAEGGAHFVMVSNVLVQSMDPERIASLSPVIHDELRNSIGFTGLIITDVLDANDYSAYADGKSVYVQAIVARNDMIIVENPGAAYDAILAAVNDGTISETYLRQVCTNIIAYKFAAGLIH